MNCRPSALELAKGFGRSAASAARTDGRRLLTGDKLPAIPGPEALAFRCPEPSRSQQPDVPSPVVISLAGRRQCFGERGVPFRRSPHRAAGVRAGAKQERARTRHFDVGAANRHVDDAHTTAVADQACRHLQCRHRRRAEHVHRQSHKPAARGRRLRLPRPELPILPAVGRAACPQLHGLRASGTGCSPSVLEMKYAPAPSPTLHHAESAHPTPRRGRIAATRSRSGRRIIDARAGCRTGRGGRPRRPACGWSARSAPWAIRGARCDKVARTAAARGSTGPPSHSTTAA